MTAHTIFQSKQSHRRRRLMTLLVAACILGLTLACLPRQTDEPPGQGEKAERGYQACAPVIEALERYEQANGAYPDDLAELVPDYLPAVPQEVNDEPIVYEKTDDGYTLSFTYTGPGLNICIHSPAGGWRCSGMY